MKGKIIEYKNNYGYIEGEDTNIYFFHKRDLEIKNIKSKNVTFRANTKKINSRYNLYKATNIISRNDEENTSFNEIKNHYNTENLQ